MNGKTHVMAVRVTPELRKACEQAAREKGMKLSTWAKTVLLESLVTPALSDPDPCADGFCPVSLFQPVDDDTEGSC